MHCGFPYSAKQVGWIKFLTSPFCSTPCALWVNRIIFLMKIRSLLHSCHYPISRFVYLQKKEESIILSLILNQGLLNVCIYCLVKIYDTELLRKCLCYIVGLFCPFWVFIHSQAQRVGECNTNCSETTRSKLVGLYNSTFSFTVTVCV